MREMHLARISQPCRSDRQIGGLDQEYVVVACARRQPDQIEAAERRLDVFAFVAGMMRALMRA